MKFKVSDFKIVEVLQKDFFVKHSSFIGDSIGYGIKLLSAEKQWQKTKGNGIKVAILDTGIDYNHPDLKERIKGGINFTTNDANDYLDRQGHGTHCAGIVGASVNNFGIVGVAPEVEIYAVKVLADDGSGSLEWIIKGIEWCIENNINVISMSLGSPDSNERLHDVIKKAYYSGITIVAAAGNEGAGIDTVGYPASYEEVISVTAVDNFEHRGNFSSTSSEVDVAAAGVDILSTFPNNQYAKLSGTSMACPHIAGAVALIQSESIINNNKLLSPKEIADFLIKNSKDEGISGKDNEYGYGLFSFK